MDLGAQVQTRRPSNADLKNGIRRILYSPVPGGQFVVLEPVIPFHDPSSESRKNSFLHLCIVLHVLPLVFILTLIDLIFLFLFVVGFIFFGVLAKLVKRISGALDSGSDKLQLQIGCFPAE